MTADGDKATKTLLDNWVEERQCQALGLERGNFNPDGSLCSKLHRQGHKGVLSTESNVPVENASTIMSSYLPPMKCEVATSGKRHLLLTESVYHSVANEVQDEIKSAHEPTPTPDSVTRQDFHHQSLSSVQQDSDAEVTHTLDEQPASYWSSNIRDVPGVSKVCSTSKPFNRNTTFSTPIGHHLDQRTA